MNLTILDEDGGALMTGASQWSYSPVLGDELPLILRAEQPTARKTHGGSAASSWSYSGPADALAVRNVTLAIVGAVQRALAAAEQLPGLGRRPIEDAVGRLLEPGGLVIGALPRGTQARWVVGTDATEIDTTFACLSTTREIEEVLVEELFHRALHLGGLRGERRHHETMAPAIDYARSVKVGATGTTRRLPPALLVLGAVGLAVWLATRR